MLAERVGRTPFYAYDRARLQARAAELRKVLPASVKLHYAMKANPMPALVAVMAALVDGIDVASAGELKIALDAGADPHEISFAGPGKTRSRAASGASPRACWSMSSRGARSALLAALSSELGLPARVAVRVNPDFELKGSGMKMGGGPKQFGVDVEAGAGELLAEIAAAGLGFEGFHLFAGSQNLRADSICEAQHKSYELALRLAARAPGAGALPQPGRRLRHPLFSGRGARSISTPIADNLDRSGRRARRARCRRHRW